MSEKYAKIEAFRTCNRKGTKIFEHEMAVQRHIIGYELGCLAWGAASPKFRATVIDGNDQVIYEEIMNMMETLVNDERRIGQVLEIIHQFDKEEGKKK